MSFSTFTFQTFYLEIHNLINITRLHPNAMIPIQSTLNFDYRNNLEFLYYVQTIPKTLLILHVLYNSPWNKHIE